MRTKKKMNITAHIDLVKEQIAYHRRMLIAGTPGKVNEAKHRALLVRWEALLEFLASLPTQPFGDGPVKPPAASGNGDSEQIKQTSFSDLSGLPQEVLKELGAAETLQKDQQIVEVVRKNGGTATLSEVLVGLYKVYGIVEKRRLLNSRLYSMVERRGLLRAVPGKKGVYTLP
jgi:hypothetical protein